jgi:putative oxidoreductase
MKTLLFWLVRTDASLGALVTRLTLGICFLPHGIQKLQKFSETMTSFTEKSGIPAPFAFLVIMAESFGAIGLILGVLGRFCAFGTALTMVGAIAMVHGKFGFFSHNKGYEYQLALLGLSIAVMIQGSGMLSFDRWLTGRLAAAKPE